MKIVVLDGYGLNPGDLSWEEMRALGELTVYDRTAPAELLERSAGAEVLITNKTVITAEDMAALPALKYIGVLATGYNIVDIQAAKARGIIVTNIPAYSTASVAQMVFAHILNITQRVGHYAYANRHGRWADNPDFCYWDTDLVELDGKKLGLPPYTRYQRAGQCRPPGPYETDGHSDKYRPRSLGERERPGRRTEQGCDSGCRTGRAFFRASPIYQPPADGEELLHYAAYRLGHERSPCPADADCSGELERIHQG